MKILLVSMNFAPEPTGIGKFSGEMAQGLCRRGHQVTVVCAPPYYPQWRVQPGYDGGRYRSEQPEERLRVLRCPVWVPGQPGGLRRLLHMASFALSSLPVLWREAARRPDVVFVVAPALASAPGAWIAARRAGALAWLHVQDLEVDAAFELGLLHGRWGRLGVQPLERALLRAFDRVSTISTRMLRRLAVKGVPLEHAALLPNGVDLSACRAVDGPTRQDLQRLLALPPGAVVALFSGTLNRKHGLEVLPAAARLLAGDPRIVIVVCGDGEMRPALERACRGLPNVRLLPLLPAAQLPAMLELADIHLLPQMRGTGDLVLPSKLGGMLASGRPVVAAARPGTELAALVQGKGRVVEPESAPALADAVRELAADPALRAHLGEVGRLHAERLLDRERLFDGLSRQLAAALALHRAGRAAPLARDPASSAGHGA
jgi:colanic acid biosynthesis glycosyl transferase WcaI